MSAEPVAVFPCGWRWLDSWIFRRRVPSYSTPSEWGPVYDRATLDAAVAAARAEERASFPNLMPVIEWLERGGDPAEAAKELRVYHYAARIIKSD